ncbi:MAG TPA: M14 family zinc carboxypeptidase [Actinomycetota bacterium]|nr:M14 family zinc carboxypeptidase [Actinomycetota bacterium]
MKSLVAAGSALSVLLLPAAPVLADDIVPVEVAAPTGVVAQQSGSGIQVTWVGSPGATSYQAEADPTGQVCSTSATSCYFAALPARSTYTFTVTASDGVSTSAASLPSAPVRLRAVLAEPIFAGSKVLVGRSQRGRGIYAVRQGDPLSVNVLLALGQMHGSEPAGLSVIDRVRRRVSPPDADYQLWTIRTMNPDGAARGNRYNARGVDLNRNFPGSWSGRHYRSGRVAASEPETRAMIRFLKRLRPTGVLSFHQPWDTTLSVCDPRSAYWVRRTADLIGLKPPAAPTRCGNWFPGTLNRWTSRNTAGWFVTVELAPSRRVGPQLPRAADAVIRIAEELSDDGPALGVSRVR